MHSRRPLRIATRIGPVETGLLTALEASYSRQSALPVEHDALGTGAALERAKGGGFGRAETGTSLFFRRDQIPVG
jgi:ABC-type tungstate transport system permease subunit